MHRITEYIWNRSTKKTLDTLDFERDCEVVSAQVNDLQHPLNGCCLEPPDILEIDENVSKYPLPPLSHVEYTRYKVQYMSNEADCVQELWILVSNVQKKMNDIYYNLNDMI